MSININEEIKIDFDRCTPAVEDLLPNKQYPCTVKECSSIFSKIGNLQMHLSKHHKVETPQVDKMDSSKFYYCPVIDCIYHESLRDGKYFTCLKYLRQHYQKMHLAKKFNCEKCEKSFPTEGMKIAHKAICGKLFICRHCDWKYTSREALLTHARRKGHPVSEEKGLNIVKVAPSIDPPAAIVVVPVCAEKQPMKDQGVQTEEMAVSCMPAPASKRSTPKRKRSEKSQTCVPKRIKNAKIQTIVSPSKRIEKKSNLEFNFDDDDNNPGEDRKPNLNRLNYVDSDNSCFDNLVMSSSLCDIETQTEFPTNILDQMLYSNMCTQTCDDLLSELGLADIQTQTNWSTGSTCDNGTLTMVSDDYSELLVSTETQTSFTQCLLNSDRVTQTGPNSNSSPITQHTQTCDTLLGGLFGGRGNDLIPSFQSAYTQT